MIGKAPGAPRRAVLLAALAAPALARPALAEPWLRNQVVVYTEPTLVPVLRAIGRAFRPQGGPVLVFAAPTAQNLALLAHGTQDDLLIGLAAFCPRAEASGLIAPGAVPLWRNPLVLAAAGAGKTEAFAADRARARLADGGKLAFPDPTPASSLDGPATLSRLGLLPLDTTRTIGAVDTGDVADLLRRGQASLGLCYATDIAPGLYPAIRLPDDAHDPTTYTLARSTKAWSRYADAFSAFLATDRAHAIARSAGLEPAA